MMTTINKVYLCDGMRKLADGACNGQAGCLYAESSAPENRYCFMTRDKKYRLTKDYWVYDPIFDKTMHGIDED